MIAQIMVLVETETFKTQLTELVFIKKKTLIDYLTH